MQSIKPLLIIAVILTTIITGSCRKERSTSLKFVNQSQAASNLPTTNCLVVATHGWIEKAEDDWPQELATGIQKRVNDSIWLCGYFDWADGSKTVNPTDAAKYARDVAGPKMAELILKTRTDWHHIHLIGHSCGCWVISEAAKILAQKTTADIHLTFLDAYVPAFWKEDKLADVNTPQGADFWAEQYFTKDLTLKWTQNNLSHAHNVNITGIDNPLKDHNFPWQWYLATVVGEFTKHSPLHKGSPIITAGGIEYGFALSREAAGDQFWQKTSSLSIDNEPVEIKKPKRSIREHLEQLKKKMK